MQNLNTVKWSLRGPSVALSRGRRYNEMKMENGMCSTQTRGESCFLVCVLVAPLLLLFPFRVVAKVVNQDSFCVWTLVVY